MNENGNGQWEVQEQTFSSALSATVPVPHHPQPQVPARIITSITNHAVKKCKVLRTSSSGTAPACQSTVATSPKARMPPPLLGHFGAISWCLARPLPRRDGPSRGHDGKAPCICTTFYAGKRVVQAKCPVWGHLVNLKSPFYGQNRNPCERVRGSLPPAAG